MKWISFLITSWKAPKPVYVKPHRVRTDRNPISTHYCPMHAWLDFAACSGLRVAIANEQAMTVDQQRYVAMFPALGDNCIDPYVSISEDQIDKLIEPVLQQAFASMAPEFPTPHSLRSVGLIWYLRCHVPFNRSKLAGRWLGMNTKHMDKYVRGGEEIAEKYNRAQKIDPVFMFWCARDSFVGYVHS